MRIALVNPRKVLVPLKDAGKRNSHYQVANGVRLFLEARGWQVAGSGNLYLYVDPPAGVKKPFRLRAEIPTREQIEQLAKELHNSRQKWSGHVGEWWLIICRPSRAVTAKRSAILRSVIGTYGRPACHS